MILFFIFVYFIRKIFIELERQKNLGHSAMSTRALAEPVQNRELPSGLPCGCRSPRL